MIIAAVTDIHGHLEAVEDCSKALSEADLVIVTGDITHFGREKDAERVIERIKRYNQRLYAVSGNCDYPEVDSFLSEEGINLDGRTVMVDGYLLSGIGGSLPCPGRTPNEHTEDEFALRLGKVQTGLQEGVRMIFVSHQPPRDTNCDLVGSGEHVGSSAVRRFILSTAPVLCFSGHIHEARGMDMVGGTRVVNPGPLFYGGYTVASCEGNNITVKIAGV